MRFSGLPPPNRSVSASSLTCKYSGLVGGNPLEVILHLQHTPSIVLPPSHPLNPFPEQFIVPASRSTRVPQAGLFQAQSSGGLACWPGALPARQRPKIIGFQTWSFGMHEGLGPYFSTRLGHKCVHKTPGLAHRHTTLVGAFPSPLPIHPWD